MGEVTGGPGYKAYGLGPPIPSGGAEKGGPSDRKVAGKGSGREYQEV